MKQVVNISKNAEEAQEWDIKQHLSMSVEERQAAARTLKERVYGKNSPDIRKLSETNEYLPFFQRFYTSWIVVLLWRIKFIF